MTRFILAGLLAISLQIPSTLGKGVLDLDVGIPRFQKVDDGLYRGGQPDAVDYKVLQEMGFRTVINFRRSDEVREEKYIVERLGMRYINIPLSAFDGVPDQSIRQFFQIMTTSSDLPAFVHCKRGADRTGVMVGFYRIAFQGWSADQAYNEARHTGMRFWYQNLRKQLQEFESKAGKYRKDFGIKVAQSNAVPRAKQSETSAAEAELEQSLGELEPLLTMLGRLSRVIR